MPPKLLFTYLVYCYVSPPPPQVIKFKAQGVSIDMLFCSLHYNALPKTCNVHDEVCVCVPVCVRV